MIVVIFTGCATVTVDEVGAEIVTLSETESVLSEESEHMSLEGYWEGALSIGGNPPLKLAFNVTQTDETYGATLSIPQQGVTNLPIESVKYDVQTNEIAFNMTALAAVFAGTVVSDKQDSIVGIFSQSGMEFPLTVVRMPEGQIRKAKMQEPVAPYPYISEDVTIIQTKEGFSLAGTVTRPKEPGRYPAVILITGSGAQDRDETIMEHKPFLVIADALTRAGIVVLRYDDRGFAASEGNVSEATTLDFADDAESVFDYLKEQSYVNPDKIGIIGHSEGGLVAMIVASRNPDVSFIISMAGSGVDGISVLEAQTTALLLAQGAPEAAIAQVVALNLAIYNTVINENIPLETRKEEISAMLASFGMDAQSIDAQKAVLFSTWYMTFLQLDPAPYVEQIDVPVLILNGTKDTQVTSQLNVPAIESALSKGGNTSYTTIVYEGFNHLFQQAQTGSVEEYGVIETTIEPIVLNDIISWILDL